MTNSVFRKSSSSGLKFFAFGKSSFTFPCLVGVSDLFVSRWTVCWVFSGFLFFGFLTRISDCNCRVRYFLVPMGFSAGLFWTVILFEFCTLWYCWNRIFSRCPPIFSNIRATICCHPASCWKIVPCYGIRFLPEEMFSWIMSISPVDWRLLILGPIGLA